MAESESKLKVTVDGKQAEQTAKKLTERFKELRAAVNAAKKAFREMDREAGRAAFQQIGNAINRLQSAINLGTKATKASTKATKGNTAAKKKQREELTRSQRAWASATKAWKTFIKTGGRMKSTLSTLTSTATGLTKIILVTGTAFGAWTLAVAKAGIATQKFTNTLFIMTGSLRDARQEMNWLFQTANKIGIIFSNAAVPFTKFAAAATGLLGRGEIREVFTAFGEVGVSLQLTRAEMTGIFLALQQIASKGIVSMEELRLQLAERVPGAMRFAAASMNMSMREFEKAVTQRTVGAAEFLKAFSVTLREVYGEAAKLASQTLYAGWNQLVNEFFRFRQLVFSSGFENGLKNLLNALTRFLQENSQLAVWLGEFSGRIFQDTADAINELSSVQVVDTLNDIIEAFESLINTMREVVHWFKEVAGGFGLGDFGQMEEQFEKNRRSIDSLTEKLVRRRGRITGMAESDSMRKVLESAQTQDERRLSTLLAANSVLLDRLSPPEPISLGRIQKTPMQGTGLSIGGGDIEQLPTGIQKAIQKASDARVAAVGRYFAELNKVKTTEDELVETYEKQFEVRSKINEYVQELRVMNGEYEKQTRLQTELDTLEERDIELNKERAKLFEKLRNEQDKLNKKQKESTSLFEDIQASYMSVSDAVVNSTTRMTDAFVEFAVTGKLQFTDLINSMIRDMARLAIQKFFIDPVFGPMMARFGESIGQMFTPSGQTVPTAGNTAAQQGWFGSFQGGGIVGDAVPVIAHRGEGIFTPEQMKALGKGGPQSIKVEIDNQSSRELEVSDAVPNMDLSQMVLSIVIKDARQRGQFTQALEGSYPALRRGV